MHVKCKPRSIHQIIHIMKVDRMHLQQYNANQLKQNFVSHNQQKQTDMPSLSIQICVDIILLRYMECYLKSMHVKMFLYTVVLIKSGWIFWLYYW